ncbi:hypothetical protein EOD43_03210 [Sphingomonas crocodyli]|uniref:Esterase n=2 Tax=Sphingomonas crocodyli TaxID=1979270 RepID=A0A437MBL8_9SPHN|nr:hypothetical protein EOD43_03210 [Sphingomonas crocodyli]
MLLAALSSSGSVAQRFEDLKKSGTSLTLRGVGSFYVGGKSVARTAAQIGLYGNGQIIVDQMYVAYMLPAKSVGTAVVMIHGGTLSGKSFETTPDGRMGWYEYFVRKGYDSYVVDQVGRGRSGFDPAKFNDVRAGVSPSGSQPNIRRIGSDTALTRFRIKQADGSDFPDSQFPLEATGELAKQVVPDMTDMYSVPNPTIPGLSELADDLTQVVMIGHSQAGRMPLEVVLLGKGNIRGIISVEPAGCTSSVYTEEQIRVLSAVPILVIFGDHLSSRQPVGANWGDALADCEAFVSRVVHAGGNASIFRPVENGFRGNSHMLMQDRNNLVVADYIIHWIERLPPKH